jgi:hypothetical protein
MGSLPDALVVFLCILGAAAVTCVGYAVHGRFAKEEFSGAAFNQQCSPEQLAYMREVRIRNQTMAFGEARPPRYPPPDM